jgi:tetratricopeptide (TPR) repeat protein
MPNALHPNVIERPLRIAAKQSYSGAMSKISHRLASLLALMITIPALVGPVALAADAPAPIGKSAHEAAAPLLDKLKTAKDTAEAIMLESKVWEAWMTSGDSKIDGMVTQSVALMRMQMFDESLAILDSVVTKAPDFAEGWNRRATLLYMMQDYNRSLADIQKVLVLEPRHFGAISGLGLISMAKGDKAGALSAYKKVLEIDPQNPSAKASVEQLDKELQGNPI